MERPRLVLAAVLIAAVSQKLACDRGEGDVPPDDVARELELAAPLVFELADDQVLRIHEAELADGRTGLLELHGDAIDVTRGRVALARVADDGRLVVEHADGSVRAVASDRNEHDEHEVFDAQLEAVEISGFDRAVFHGPRGDETLRGPITLDAVGLAWSGHELRVVAGRHDADEATADRGTTAGARVSRARLRGLATAHVGETAHAGDQGPAAGDALQADAEPLVAPGDPCTSTAACDMGTVCVADSVTSDGAFRCLAECVPPVPQVSEDPLMESSTAVCVDDGGCCDPSRECSNGECVLPSTSSGGDGGGSGPSNDVDPDAAGGCDPDGDNVISACDAHPNESCSADNDGDGCNNSFDGDDQDSCRCNVKIPKPNGLAILMLGLAFLRGRHRRRR